MDLVLSLFPGIDLLGHAFSLEGFAVVRGPDPALGTGDIRTFDVPSRFDGIIGGSPCQDFSRARRSPPTGEGLELLGHFKRIVESCRPYWWVLENVPSVPNLIIEGYRHQRIDLRACEFGHRQNRLRHFQFGSIYWPPLIVPRGQSVTELQRCVMASEGSRPGRRSLADVAELQGMPRDFDIRYFTMGAKYSALGNGVPIGMGRAIARAIKAHGCDTTATACACGCGREVTGKAKSATPACRKRLERRRLQHRQM